MPSTDTEVSSILWSNCLPRGLLASWHFSSPIQIGMQHGVELGGYSESGSIVDRTICRGPTAVTRKIHLLISLVI
jgi:hypothetical protein